MGSSTNIGSLVVEVDGNIGGLQNQIKAARGVVNGLTDDVKAKSEAAKNSFETVLNPIKNLSNMLGPLALGFGAILSINAFGNLINSTADAAGKMEDLSMQTGISVENLSALEEVGKFSDVSLDKIASTANKMSKNLLSATEEGKGAAAALRTLNIDLDDFRKLSPDQQMLSVAKAMDNFADGGGKSATAMALMGKEGAAMIPFMKDLAETGELNARVTTEQAATAGRYGDNLTKIQTASEEWKRHLALSMLPVMEEVTGAWLAATGGNDGLTASIKKLAADGTFEQWARNAVIGVSYLIDVGHGLFSLLPLIGTAIAGMAAASSAAFGAIYEAFLKIKAGDLNGAWDSIKTGANEVGAIAKDVGQDISGIWNQELLGEKIRKGMDQVREARKEAAKPIVTKPQLDTAEFVSTKSIKEKTSAYETLINTINEKMALQAAEMQGEKELTEVEKYSLKIMTDIQQGTLKLTEAEKLNLGTMLEKLSVDEKSNITRKEMLKLGADLVKSGNDQLKSIDAQIESAARQNEEVGLTTEQVDQLSISRLRLAAAADDELAANVRLGANVAGDLKEAYLEYAGTLEQAAEKKRKLAEIKAFGNEKQADADNAKRQLAEQVDFWKSIDDTAHDTFISIANGTKNLATRAKESLNNILFEWLYQMTIKKWIINISAGATFSATGAASAQGVGGLGSTVSAISTGASLWEGFATAGTAAGVFGSTGFMASLAGGLNGAGIGSGLTSAAGLSIGGGIQSVIGTSAAGSLSSGVSAISGVLGAIPVWGWAALGAAAIAASLGGGKDRVIGAQSVSGTLGTNDINRNVDWTKDGGWFNSNTSGTWNYNLANSTAKASNGQFYQDTANVANDQKLLSQLNSTYDTIKAASANYATALGLNADVIIGRVDKMSFVLGKTQEEIDKAIQDMFGGIADDMARSLIPSISEMSKEGETASATLGRIATGFGTANAIFADLNLNLFSLNEQGYKASATFVELVGGIDSLKAKSQSYYQNFFSEEERNASVLKSLTSEFEKQNLVLPASRDAYRALVESVKEVGTPEQLATLFNLNETFASIFNTADNSATILQQKIALDDEYNKLTMTSLELLALERAKIDESNLARFDSIQAIKAESLAREESLRVVAEFNSMYAASQEAATQILTEVMNKEGALRRIEIKDRNELSAAMASKSATDKAAYLANINDGQNFINQYVRMFATEIEGLASAFEYASKNALAMQNVEKIFANIRNEALSEYINGTFLKSKATLNASADSAGITSIAKSSGISQLIEEVATSAALAFMGGSGVGGILAVNEQMRSLNDVSAIYVRTASTLKDELNLGRISLDEYTKSINFSQEMTLKAGAAIDERTRKEMQLELRSREVSAGIDSANFYFDALSSTVEKLNEASKKASEPISMLAETLGRLQSAQYVFDASAKAIGGDKSGAQEQAISSAIAAVAADAMTWLNTQGGKAVADQFANNPLFANVDFQKIGPMLDSVSAWNIIGYETAFTRMSDALAIGSINTEQYAQLMGVAKNKFKGATDSLVDSAQKASSSLIDFKNKLLSDYATDTSSESGYAYSLNALSSANANNVQGLVTSYIEAAKNNATNLTDYLTAVDRGVLAVERFIPNAGGSADAKHKELVDTVKLLTAEVVKLKTELEQIKENTEAGATHIYSLKQIQEKWDVEGLSVITSAEIVEAQ